PYKGEFDAVFSNAVLHWISDAEAVVQGVVQALKNGGRFVAEFGGKGNVRWIVSGLQLAAEVLGYGRIESPWYYPCVAQYAGLLEQLGLEPVFATLFPRPVALEGAEGLRNWIRMFGGAFLQRIPLAEHDVYLQTVENYLKSELYRDGSWHADYRRLR